MLAEEVFVSLREFEQWKSVEKLKKGGGFGGKGVGGCGGVGGSGGGVGGSGGGGQEDKMDKMLVDLEYDVKRRIGGVLELNVALIKFLNVRTMGQSPLPGWMSIFKDARATISTFPFFSVSNEVTFKLKTKY